MHELLKKLQFADETILLQNPPSELEPIFAAWAQETKLHTTPQQPCGFVLVFATTLAEVEQTAAHIEQLLSEGDSKLWMVYPKNTSKRYKCEFNRDTGFAALGHRGLEPVRMVALSEDWSALRFRRVEFIKNLTRQSALSAVGQQRIAKK